MYVEAMTRIYRLVRLNRREFEIRGDHAVAMIMFRRGTASTISTAVEWFDLVRSGWSAPSIIEQRRDEPSERVIARGSCSGRYVMTVDETKLRFGPLSIFGGTYGWSQQNGAAIVRYPPLSWSMRDHSIEVDLPDDSNVVRLMSIGAYLLQLAYQESAAVTLIAAAGAAIS